MALVANIVVDLASGTIVLTSTVSGSSVETITYNNSTNQVTFASRGNLIIDFSEFLPFCDQVNIFQTAILFNYASINVFSTIPFSQIIINEIHSAGTWNLTVSIPTPPNIVEYKGTQSTKKIELVKRPGSNTLSFPEWQYFLQALNHYRLSIKSF